MWEDNNPLSYERRSSTSSFSPTDLTYGSSPPALYSPHMSHSYSNTMTQNISEQEEEDDDMHTINNPVSLGEQSNENSDDDEDDDDDYPAARSVGYHSRVSQILAENKDLAILITDAGKNMEGGGGGYIVYTIRTGDLEVRRRYSEFESLRKNLSLLYPCLIVPPIPEKHSLSDYATAPRHAKDDITTIELRKRMLGVFLNRCLRMKEIRRDSVFARFLDPNVSWSEVLNSPPISTLPKAHLRAPPSDPSNPTPAHAFLPIPPASMKLRSPLSAVAETALNPYGHRFPPADRTLKEPELDAYFNNYEISTKDYEALLTGSIEKVNRRILKRLSELASDYSDLGARYNAFSLSESGSLASAIERIGQAVDSSYIATEELARVLSSSFAEPLRESAQFAGVVRSVLKYRVNKRLQAQITKDQLTNQRNTLEDLERSEMEARRIEQFLTGETTHRRGLEDRDDVESIDSADFPPTHGESPPKSISSNSPKRSQSTKSSAGGSSGGRTSGHRKTVSVGAAASSTAATTSSSGASGLASSVIGGVGNGLSSKIFGRLSYAVHGIVDVDPETTRRNNIGKTKERIVQLEQALKASEKDVQDASAGILKDLKRFQKEKEEDLKRMMVAYAKCHIEWAKKNLETWEEAKAEVDKIQAR